VKIARVFPVRTSMTPTDPDAYVGLPTMFMPCYDEIHISCVFTWDIPKVRQLTKEWCQYAPVFEGGPAFDDKGENFESGRYLKSGVTITSRGCPNNCSFCFVPKREGKIRELPIVEGNIIQDNNLLACSKSHIDKVFSMLKTQRYIDFSGGFEASRITDEVVEQLRELKIYQMWLAYDHDNADKSLKKAVNKLSKYFKRDKIRCYVLIGYENDTIDKAKNRLRKAWEIGTLPFAMLYKPKDYTKDWKIFQRQWTRPAIIKSMNSQKNRRYV